MAFVYPTGKLKRYAFPSHINDIIYCRSAAECSEAFIVVLRPGKAPPRHKHDDTEQVFYVLSGRGVLTVGDRDKRYPVKRGDVVLVPPGTWHSIRSVGGTMTARSMDIVAGIWSHSAGIEKAMKEKGNTLPQFKKGELADLLEFVRAPKKKQKGN